MIKYLRRIIERSSHNARSSSNLIKTIMEKPTEYKCLGTFILNHLAKIQDEYDRPFEDGSGSQFMRTNMYFTYSRNDGPIQRVCVDLHSAFNNEGYGPNFTQIVADSIKLDRDLCRGQDGEGLAFYLEDGSDFIPYKLIPTFTESRPHVPEPTFFSSSVSTFDVPDGMLPLPQEESDESKHAYRLSGISGDGMFPDETMYNKDASLVAIPKILSSEKITHLEDTPRWYPVNDILPENNKLTIYPTEHDDLVAFDLFEALGGTGTTPLVITSCVSVTPRRVECLPSSIVGSKIYGNYSRQVQMEDSTELTMSASPFNFMAFSDFAYGYYKQDRYPKFGLDESSYRFVLTYSKNGSPPNTIKWFTGEPYSKGDRLRVWDAVKALTLDVTGRTAFILTHFNALSPVIYNNPIHNTHSGISSNARFTYAGPGNSPVDQYDEIIEPVTYFSQLHTDTAGVQLKDGVIDFNYAYEGFKWEQNELIIYPSENIDGDETDYYQVLCRTQEQFDAGEPIVIQSCGVLEPKNFQHVDSSLRLKIPLTEDASTTYSLSMKMNDGKIKDYTFTTDSTTYETTIARVINEILTLGNEISPTSANDLYFRIVMPQEQPVQRELTDHFVMNIAGCNGLEYGDDTNLQVFNKMSTPVSVVRLEPKYSDVTIDSQHNSITFVRKTIPGCTDFFDNIIDAVDDTYTVHSAVKIPFVFEGVDISDDTIPFDVTATAVGEFGRLKLRIENMSSRWELFEDGVLLASHNLDNVNVLVDSYGGNTTLEIDDIIDTTKNFKLYAGGRNLRMTMSSGMAESRGVTVNTFSSIINQYRFSTEDVGLTVPTKLPKHITSLYRMFDDATVFNQDISMWDTSHVTDMERTFDTCTNFNQPLNSWNTSNVTTMDSMFQSCDAFNQPLNNWDVSKVTIMDDMFTHCYAFDQPLNNWDTSSVTNMSNMFYEATVFNQNLDSWNVRNVTTMYGMFGYCALFNQPLNSWNTSNVTNMGWMFEGANVFNQPLDNWDTSKVTDMSGMFDYAYEFNQPIGMWDTSYVTNMDWMFEECYAFNQPLGDWNVSNVTPLKNVFVSATSFNQDLSNWCVSHIPVEPVGFSDDTPAWVKPKPIWGTCPGGGVTPPPDDITNIIPFTFTNVSKPNTTGITSFDIGISNTSGYWEVHESGTLIASPNYRAPGVSFESDTDSYRSIVIQNMNGVTRSFEVYVNASSVSVGIDNLYTAPGDVEFRVTSFGVVAPKMIFRTGNAIIYMPESLPPHITDCEGMFNSVQGIATDITKWDVSNVTNMAFMFADSRTFNQNISGWDVSNVTQMHSMFWAARDFNQDLSGWCVSNIATYPNGFASEANSWTLPQPVWGTCPAPVVNIPENALVVELTKFRNGYYSAAQSDVGLSRTARTSANWQLHNAITGELLCDQNGIYNTSLIYDAGTDGTTYIRLPLNEKLTVAMSGGFIGIEIYVGAVQRYSNDMSVYGSVNVLRYPNNIASIKHNVEGYTLTIPHELPPEMSSLDHYFRDSNLFNQDISHWNITGVGSTMNMFYGAKSFNQDIGDWDVSSVNSMGNMFTSAQSFNQDLSRWCVKRIPELSYQWDYDTPAWTLPKPVWGTCPGPAITLPSTQPLHFSLVSEDNSNGRASFGVTVEGISGEWYVLINDRVVAGTNQTNVDGFDAGIYEDTLNITINNLVGVTTDVKVYSTAVSVRLHNVATPSNPVGRHVNVVSFSDTISSYLFEFKHCTATVPSVLPAHITSLSDMFSGSDKFNQDLSGWDTSNVVEMSRTFNGCESFNGNITTWNTSNVTMMESMFNRAKIFNQDIGSWNVGKVERMNYMFAQAHVFNQDLSSWNVSLIPSQPFSFDHLVNAWLLPKPIWGTTGNIVSPSQTPLSFNMTSTEYGGFMLTIADTVTSWRVLQNDVVIDSGTEAIYEKVISGILAGDVNIKVYADADYITVGYTDRALMSSITVNDFGSTVSNVRFAMQDVPLTVPTSIPATLTDLTDMFRTSYNFNQDIGMWDTTHVTNMRSMFFTCFKFNQDISGWNVSNVTDMSNMFTSANVFNQNIDNWNVTNVTSMQNLFNGAAAFNQPLNTWDVSNVTNMSNMFEDTTAFNQPLNNWNVTKVTYMGSMFRLARGFNQDLSGWNVAHISTKPRDFDTYADQWMLPKPIWGTTGTPPNSAWVMSDEPTSNGRDVTITATKRTNAVNYTSTINSTPAPSEVKDNISTSVAQPAIMSALTKLIGSVTEWSLDINNNRIIYN